MLQIIVMIAIAAAAFWWLPIVIASVVGIVVFFLVLDGLGGLVFALEPVPRQGFFESALRLGLAGLDGLGFHEALFEAHGLFFGFTTDDGEAQSHNEDGQQRVLHRRSLPFLTKNTHDKYQ